MIGIERMNNFKSLKDDLFNINKENFEEHALQLFYFQAENNPVYKQYITYSGRKIEEVNRIEDIPFMPIGFFKTKAVKTLDWESVRMFESSGTTGEVKSKHHIEDLTFYDRVSKAIFESKYGNLRDYHILALLPGYLERGNSSLVAMVDSFIKAGNSRYSGFYLNNVKDLLSKLDALRDRSEPVILIGVSFALLDMAEEYQPDLSHVVVMETGGMKGRREELTREALHKILREKLNVGTIHSEYGMTELLSQAYASENGIFEPPPWMRVLIRDANDPYSLHNQFVTGGVNVIDLANIQSCAFIETQDLGKKKNDEEFEILGRFDNSDIRGCNLMTLSL